MTLHLYTGITIFLDLVEEGKEKLQTRKNFWYSNWVYEKKKKKKKKKIKN